MRIFKARRRDVDEILKLISKLCDYVGYNEFMPNKAKFISDIFDKKLAHMLVCRVDDKIVGYIIYYYTYCAFAQSGGIFLDNIFIDEKFRKLGIAKEFFNELEAIAKRENFKFIEWICKKSNKKSLEFYHHIGAKMQINHERFKLDVK